jgi:hypothetical protein
MAIVSPSQPKPAVIHRTSISVMAYHHSSRRQCLENALIALEIVDAKVKSKIPPA